MDMTGRRVLLVDDEPWSVEVVESYLRGAGYSVRSAGSGEDALGEFERERPDILLLDVIMPGMDGLEVCRRLKGLAGPGFVPVVLITSLDRWEDRSAVMRSGADDFIGKPVDEGVLLEKVGALLKAKSMYDELERKYREALDLQIMKDNLVGMLVHDFRGPLTGIMGYLDLLRGNEDYAVKEQYILNAKYLSRRLAAMVNDIMDLTRIEKGRLPLRLAETSMAGVVEEALDEFRHALRERGVSASVAVEGDAVLHTDRGLMVRVVGNIIANAARHCKEGGAITFTITRAARKVELVISNDGEPIPGGHLDRIFEKFHQVEARAANVKSGAGLGLSFCDLVVKAHGGAIRAENNDGPGCRFIISLPAMDAGAEGRDG